MRSASLFQNWRSRLLSRGERGVALMGIAMMLILLFTFAASTWQMDREQRTVADRERLDQLKTLGPVIAGDCQRMIAANDLAALHRLAEELPAKLKLSAFSISVGSDRVLADMAMTRVNVRQIPSHWIASDLIDSSSQTASAELLRFPFVVPGRGAGSLELASATISPADYSRFSSAALCCAVGLSLLMIVYRRSRQGLAEMEVVRGSLAAMGEGETSLAALQVDSKLGTAAWSRRLQRWILRSSIDC